MKRILFAATLALFATTQAFAIAGIGAHYVMNTGSLKSNEGGIDGDGNISIKQESASGLKGLGFKAWIDFLPFVDIEGTFNVAATRYKSTLIVDGKEIPLTYSPDAPYSMVFDRADPIYGVVTGDVSVTYPFDILPIIRPYIGAGLSYIASIPIINRDFTRNVIDKMDASDLAATIGSNPDELGTAVVKALKDESYKSGIGGHAIAGLRIKPPIFPIAAYVNGKYYFGGNTSSQFTQGFVLEVGGGFAL